MNVLTLDELYPSVPFRNDVVVKPIPWFVSGLWQLGKINVVFGYEKSGKSRLLTFLMLHALQGIPVFNELAVVQPKKVLWLAGEELPEDVNARMLQQAAFVGIAPRTLQFADRLTFKSVAGMRLDIDKQREWLKEQLTNHGYDVLIIDPLRRVHGAKENDNSGGMSMLLNDLRKWSNTLHVTIIVLHHTGKVREDADWNRIATWSRGATDLPTVLDTAMFLERQTNNVVRIMRQGRYKPLKDLYLLDGNEDEFSFKLRRK